MNVYFRKRLKKDTLLQRKYYKFNKPYGYLSQFTDEGKWKGLSQILSVPEDVYSVGRLDAESEGLLLLTNDKTINQRLLHPKNKHERCYLAQVEGELDENSLVKLSHSVSIKINKKTYSTLAAKAIRSEIPDFLWDREPPIRERKSIPTSWLNLTLIEGKNRQVRKMTAAVGYPTLRLIRYSIENLTLETLSPGEIIECEEFEFKRMLNL